MALRYIYGRPLLIPGMPEEDWAEAKRVIEARKVNDELEQLRKREQSWRNFKDAYFWCSLPLVLAVVVPKAIAFVQFFLSLLPPSPN